MLSDEITRIYGKWKVMDYADCAEDDVVVVKRGYAVIIDDGVIKVNDQYFKYEGFETSTLDNLIFYNLKMVREEIGVMIAHEVDKDKPSRLTVSFDIAGGRMFGIEKWPNSPTPTT